MGRQVTVQVVRLLDAGCILQIQDYDQPGAYLRVTLPDGRTINSDADDCLTFDCRDRNSSPNGWVEDWLIRAHVKHTTI
jgi:hypothetical protein